MLIPRDPDDPRANDDSQDQSADDTERQMQKIQIKLHQSQVSFDDPSIGNDTSLLKSSFSNLAKDLLKSNIEWIQKGFKDLNYIEMFNYHL